MPNCASWALSNAAALRLWAATSNSAINVNSNALPTTAAATGIAQNVNP
jgi:hypothetical protein